MKKENQIIYNTAEELTQTINKTSFYFKDCSPQIKEKKKDNYVYVPAGVWLTGAPLIWMQGYTGEGCKVGIIDSGVDPSHKDLKSFYFD